ncbi:MAG TPA: hypothetical protein VGY54_08210 [Polyangiaceae bacterium]|nr:hypothetical protein [Polyangiaceae bacterium]
MLREQLGQRRVRLTDDHRRRLAVRAKALGRAALSDVAGIVTPDTLLRWCNLVARKYDGSQSRTVGRPRTAAAIAKLVDVWPRRTRAGDGHERFSNLVRSSGILAVYKRSRP